MVDNNAYSPLGRIWILFNSSVFSVSVVCSSIQYIHYLIRYQGITFIWTVVYGANDVGDRRTLWDELKTIAIGISGPWMIEGDFNALLSNTERDGGVEVEEASHSENQECIFSYDLLITEVCFTLYVD